jgi:CheY-like chemotaxis protein
LARGMIVESAASSEEALSHLASHHYEIVLCDFNLPGLNGEQFFERIRSQAGAATPRFIFMTGALLDPSTIEEFSKKGAALLQKPFHVSALAELLVQLLQPQIPRKN